MKIRLLLFLQIPGIKSSDLQNGHVSLESSLCLEARQVGAGQGGEGADDGKGQGPVSRRRDGGREGHGHNWRDRKTPPTPPARLPLPETVCLINNKILWLWPAGGVPQGSPRWGAPGGGGGAGRGGGDGSEGGAERLHDTQLQQQIVVALRRLREDMRSVMDRLEVVERLAATHVSHRGEKL